MYFFGFSFISSINLFKLRIDEFRFSYNSSLLINLPKLEDSEFKFWITEFIPSVDSFISVRTFEIPNSFKSLVTFERLLLIDSILSNVNVFFF